MNTQRTNFELFLLFVITLFVTAVSFGQGNTTLYGDVTGTGTINVNGNLTNAKGANLTIAPTVNVKGAGATTQTIANSSGSWTINFSTLQFGNSKPKAFGTTTSAAVSTALNFGYTSNTLSGNFSLGANTLSVAAASTYFTGSTGALTLSSGTVNYTGTAAQSLLNYAATYGTLGISGAGLKTLPSSAASSATGTVTHAGGAITFNDNFTVTSAGSASFGAISDVASGKVVDLQGTSTGSSVTTLSTLTGTLRNSGSQALAVTTVTATTATGILENTGTGGLTVTTLTANAGTIRNTSTGSVTFTNAAANAGTISASAGSVTFSNNLSGAGAVTLTGGTMNFGGTVAQGTYTLTAGTTVYNASAAQNVVGTTYNNLTLNNSAKTLAAAAAVNGALVLDASSSLALGNYTLTDAGNITLGSDITMGATGKVKITAAAAGISGSGFIQGSVERNHDFAANTPYKFNGTNIYLATAAQTGADVTLSMTAATAPTNYSSASTKYINRKYALTVATNALTLTQAQLYYATLPTTEVMGGLVENKIGMRYYSGSAWSKVAHTSMSSGSNLVTIAGGSQALAVGSTQELGMFARTFVTSAAADIALATTWDEGSVPTVDDDATINTAATMASAVSVSSLAVNSGMSLAVSAGNLAVTNQIDNAGSLTVNGGTTSAATLNVTGSGTAKVGTTGSLTVTGTWTNNTSGSATSAGTGTIGVGTLANTAGTLTFQNTTTNLGALSSNGGVINVGGVSGTETVNLATGVASTVDIGGTLLVDQYGVLNIGSATIASNLTMENTGTHLLQVNSGGALNVFGDVVVNTGVTLTNNGTITVGQ